MQKNITSLIESVHRLPSNRLLSLDVFRGLTILVMVFVNDIASVQGIPGWLKHKNLHESGMTFVDAVFPAFLFIVGVSVPFAFSKYDSKLLLLKHILIRTLSLLILGVLMVNMGSYESGLFLSKNLWTLLVYLAAFAAWGTWLKDRSKNIVINGFGMVCLVLLALLFRGKEGQWLTTQWWGILGLIGWAYLTVGAVYLAAKNRPAAILGVVALLTALYIGDHSGQLSLVPQIITKHLFIGSHIGTHGLISVSGLFAGTLIYLFQNTAHNSNVVKSVISPLLWFASGLLVAGYLLTASYPISKMLATPSWGLISAGASLITFVILYWVIDVRNFRKGWGVLVHSGQNPLLIYLLPGIFYALYGIFGFSLYWTWGKSFNSGLLRSVLFTAIIVLIGCFFNRIGKRLKL